MALAKDYDSVMGRSNEIMKKLLDLTTMILNQVQLHLITKL